MSPSSGPSRSLSIGDECPVCGQMVTETTAGGLLAYCWWCNDRTMNPAEASSLSDVEDQQM